MVGIDSGGGVEVLRNLVRRVGVATARLIPHGSAAYRALQLAADTLPSSLRQSYGEGRIAHSIAAFANENQGRPVTFIQVGSNDGVTGDPIHFYVCRDNWRGLLVEPVREAYDALIRNYANHKNLVFLRAAVGEVDGEIKIYRVAETEGAPFWASQIASTDYDVLRKHRDAIPDLERRVVSEIVPCFRLPTLIEKNGLQKVDLLHLDMEGGDFRALQQLDFGPVRPTLIIYEHIHLRPEEAEGARRLLTYHGYSLTVEGRNTLAVRRDV